jgi:hypothetical protein
MESSVRLVAVLLHVPCDGLWRSCNALSTFVFGGLVLRIQQVGIGSITECLSGNVVSNAVVADAQVGFVMGIKDSVHTVEVRRHLADSQGNIQAP